MTRGNPRMSAPSGAATQRLRTDADTVERDLAKLVLTVVELLRQLMERQALHRVDKGDLTEAQEERVGMTLMILQQRMEEMCARHDLRMEDLNLDLGPLGTLLSPAGSSAGSPAGPPSR
ncbi:gas vesicle protein K [Streptomyces endocoffeicus]